LFNCDHDRDRGAGYDRDHDAGYDRDRGHDAGYAEELVVYEWKRRRYQKRRYQYQWERRYYQKEYFLFLVPSTMISSPSIPSCL
jgi:hypothetical protein